MTQEQLQGFVVDTLASTGPRTHSIILSFDKAGKPALLKDYHLTADKPVPMPLDHAMQFLKDKAFIVTNAKGEVMKPMENIAEVAAHVSIPEGYVLAKYEELTRDALVLRAKVLPNSGSIHPVKSKAADIIAFLKADEAAKHKAETPPGMTDKELDELFKD